MELGCSPHDTRRRSCEPPIGPESGARLCGASCTVEKRPKTFNEGRHISDAEYLIWMARVRLHLTSEEKAFFDKSTKDSSIDEFRAEKAAALVTILMDRHGFPVAKVKG
jgi:hypothetical protein